MARKHAQERLLSSGPRNWDEVLDELHVFTRGQERAPHKPLLLLMVMAQVQRGGQNEFRFANLDAPLKELLKRFGFRRKSYHPEYPFWHLQTDRCWAVDGADSLPIRRGGSSVSRRELFERDVAARVPEGLWRDLEMNPKEVQRVAAALLDEFWPRTLHEAIAAAVGLELGVNSSATARRKRDPNFRPMVFRAYEGRCAVCGYDAQLTDVPFGLDAAHIRWHAYEGPDIIANGLALCALHHVAFDSGALSLSDDRRILVSQDLRGQAGLVRQGLIGFHDQRLQSPQSDEYLPGREFIQWHRKQVFREPPRQIRLVSEAAERGNAYSDDTIG